MALNFYEVSGKYAWALVRASSPEQALQLARKNTTEFNNSNADSVTLVQVPKREGVYHLVIE